MEWKVPLFDLNFGEAEKQAVNQAIDSKWISSGARTAEFENRFAALSGAKYAVAVNSCTAALHLAVLCLGIGPGDEVIVPSLTFAATANAVYYTGAKPVFADVISKEDLTISPRDIADKIG
ncbi:MAG: aminotransferase class I/II-fold pyridoxal phosphate-dependent enzyme, partial [Syntrophomonadaceae bacterium]|nr:aminotransferase class I/II-fold pyridoxal phosphate-dependent enzyme [Syntrophomonadaceae bacterium]